MMTHRCHFFLFKYKEEGNDSNCHHLCHCNASIEENDGTLSLHHHLFLLKHREEGNDDNKLPSPSWLQHHNRRKQQCIVIVFFFLNIEKKVTIVSYYRHLHCNNTTKEENDNVPSFSSSQTQRKR
jgi:hypothetical protein